MTWVQCVIAFVVFSWRRLTRGDGNRGSSECGRSGSKLGKAKGTVHSRQRSRRRCRSSVGGPENVSRSTGFQWQPCDEPRSAGLVLLHYQRAFMLFGDPAGDRQPEAGAGCRRARRLEAHESFEDPLAIGCRNAGACVGYRNGCVGLVGGDSNRHRTAGAGVLDSIVEQIGDQLAKQTIIGIQGHVGLESSRQLASLRAGSPGLPRPPRRLSHTPRRLRRGKADVGSIGTLPHPLSRARTCPRPFG